MVRVSPPLNPPRARGGSSQREQGGRTTQLAPKVKCTRGRNNRWTPPGRCAILVICMAIECPLLGREHVRGYRDAGEWIA